MTEETKKKLVKAGKITGYVLGGIVLGAIAVFTGIFIGKKIAGNASDACDANDTCSGGEDAGGQE